MGHIFNEIVRSYFDIGGGIEVIILQNAQGDLIYLKIERYE